jgi:sulfatase modifying factor 1
MVDIQLACIDRYEAPNEAGKEPLLMLNQTEAEAFCSERGKRLCTEDEWVRACKGPSGWLYPYGPRYQEHACNQDKKYRAASWKKLGRWPAPEASAEVARLNQSEPSGQRQSCGSAEGVYDLTGNVGEWVVKLHEHPEACLDEEQKSHRYVVMGCYWGKCFRAPHLPTCEYVNCSHAAGFHSYEFGARCCRDRAPVDEKH